MHKLSQRALLTICWIMVNIMVNSQSLIQYPNSILMMITTCIIPQNMVEGVLYMQCLLDDSMSIAHTVFFCLCLMFACLFVYLFGFFLQHFRGRKNRCFSLAVRAVRRAFVYATKGRQLKKRNMRTVHVFHTASQHWRFNNINKDYVWATNIILFPFHDLVMLLITLSSLLYLNCSCGSQGLQQVHTNMAWDIQSSWTTLLR